MPMKTDRPEMYKAARAWKDAALLDNDSLFTPGQEIWSTRWLDELHERFVLGADDGGGSFRTKLERQLQDADPAVVQLMAEMLFVHFLAVGRSGRKGMRRQTKREYVGWVLSWSSVPVDVSPDFETGVNGFGYLTTRNIVYAIRFLIRFARRWKARSDEDRRYLLDDPWAFKEMLWEVPIDSAYMQREVLLHLVHPDTFEPISMREDKEKMAKSYADLVSKPTDDIDCQLAQIRAALTPKYGQGFYFWDEEVVNDRAGDPYPPPNGTESVEIEIRVESRADLAKRLFIDVVYLDRIVRLLEHRRQVIFYGPPGTGKTFVARELAAHLARHQQDRVRLVQFHPSYAYEDFVEGYRPARTRGGAAGFELREGPLKRMARRAEQARAVTFVLIIDEINRGNLSKVLGELYFLLEYRKEKITLQYSDEHFSLPPNLWIIGTMNTADRSIALVDSALRRRFHFSPFFPDEPPIEGLLARWLKAKHPEMAWVADVLDLANQKLGRRHTAIGPSHFMHEDLDDEWVELIWENSVLPYIAEQFFGEDDRLGDFDLDRLRGQATSTAEAGDQGGTDPEEQGPGDA